MTFIFGLGHWSRYFVYILISDFTKFLKDDVLEMGANKHVIFFLKIDYHPVIILLIGFISDFIISLIIWFVDNYRENKKEERKNLLLIENEGQISKENSSDKKLELRDTSNLNEPINNDDGLNDSNKENSLKYYLIHNELTTEEDLVLE